MDTIAIIFHIFICLFLIGVIMLQHGKGADVGAVFGGASQTLFGGRGPATFLNKLTIIVSILFFLSSVWLATIGTHKASETVIDKAPVQEIMPAMEETVPAEQPSDATKSTDK